MSKAIGTLGRYFVATSLALVGASALTHGLLGTSYAGASDDTAVRTGMAIYGGYLREVGLCIAGLVGCQVLRFFVLSSGLLAWAPWVRRAGMQTWLTLSGLGILVGTMAVGHEAYRHPGLFLPLASAGFPGVLWVEASGLLWPILLFASGAGFIKGLLRLTNRWERSACGAGAALVLMTLGLGRDVLPTTSGPLPGDSKQRATRPDPRSITSPRQRPNLLIVGVDSLRPDKIDPENTPVLAHLVSESIYFPNTIVALPRTAPSWTALLTSLPPLQNGIETMFPGGSRTDLTKMAMPAHLRSLGYRTAVFSEYAGEFFTRISLGFDRVDVPEVELKEMLGQAFLAKHPIATALLSRLYTLGPWPRRHLPPVLAHLVRGLASFSHPAVLEEDFMSWLAEERKTEPASEARPWFALLFYSQPHFPYTSSRAFREKGAVAGSDSSLRYGKDVTRGEVRSAADREQIDRLYRSALGETDRALGSLLSRIERNRELSDTIIILTADHGEGLYECPRCIGHGDNLDGLVTLRVPLAMRLPTPRWGGSEHKTITPFVSQLDVYPTILELLHVPVPPTLEGRNLLDRDGHIEDGILSGAPRTFFVETGEWLWPSAAVPADRMAYPPITQMAELESDRVVIGEQHLPVVRAAKHRGALCPPFLLAYEPTRNEAHYHLYNLDEDPFAQVDVTDRYPKRAKVLKEAVRRSVLRFPSMIEVDGFFLTRPDPPLEEYW